MKFHFVFYVFMIDLADCDAIILNKAKQLIDKYLDKSFPVFHTPLTAGLQPAGQCRRVANPARAMLGK